MPSIGQEIGPAAAGLGARLLHPGDGHGLTAAIGDAEDHVVDAGSKQDDAVTVPTASAAVGSVAEALHDATGSLHLFQFAAGEEADELAVRRPEGIVSAFGP